MADEFDFDDEAKSVTFSGDRLHLLLTLISRAKFGDRHDKMLLLNGWLAELSLRIVGALGLEGRMSQAGVPDKAAIFDDDFVLAVSDAIISDGAAIGWWAKTVEQRRQYLREVVAAPVGMTDRDIERIEDAIESWIFRARLTLTAVDAGN